MIANVLIMNTSDHQFTFEEMEDFSRFYRNNKIRFYHKKCNDRPFFELHIVDGCIEMHENGRPVIDHISYDDKTKQVGEKKILIPLEIVEEKLNVIHKFSIEGQVASCHPTSVKALVKTFNVNYHFKGINAEAKKYLSVCRTCAKNKLLPMTNLPPQIPIRSYLPNERIQFDLVDIAGKTRTYTLNNSWHFRYVLVLKDCFSKYCWLFPLVKKDAEKIYYAANFVFQHEGYPEIFQSDNGKEFVAKIVSNFLQTNHVKIKHGKPYHPQSQGQVENLNKRVKKTLSRVLQHLSPDVQGQVWPLFLPGVASLINNTWHSTIDDIPFRVYKQREPSSLGYTVVPEDFVWCKENSTETDEFDDTEMSSDDEEGNQTADKDIYPTETEINIDITTSELYQMCTSAAITKDGFRRSNTSMNVAVDESSTIMVEDGEFCLKEFNTALFQLGEKQIQSHLSALEATIYNSQEHKAQTEIL